MTKLAHIALTKGQAVMIRPDCYPTSVWFGHVLDHKPHPRTGTRRVRYRVGGCQFTSSYNPGELTAVAFAIVPYANPVLAAAIKHVDDHYEAQAQVTAHNEIYKEKRIVLIHAPALAVAD